MKKSLLLGGAVLGCAVWFAGAASAGPNEDNDGYYTIKQDVRRCMYPMCGGSFLTSVNKKQTVCHDGKKDERCYVAEVDWDALQLSAAQLKDVRAWNANVVVQGDVESVRINGKEYGRLVPSRAFLAASDDASEGKFYRAYETQIRCVTTPCPTDFVGKLNTKRSTLVSTVNVAALDLSDAEFEAAVGAFEQEELVLTGSFQRAWDWSTWTYDKTFVADQIYLPVMAEEKAECITTGCSGQICASEEVVSTCEWREEYECVKQQVCEVQDDGACGWTPTEESSACFEALTGSEEPGSEGRVYSVLGAEECARVRFTCDVGHQPFFDDIGCGCEPIPQREYSSRDPEECRAMLIRCDDGKEFFSDETGCGCE